MKTSIGFALGMVLSFGTVGAASAAGTSELAPPRPPAGIEVIVVTAKRPAATQPVDAVQPIYELIVTGKRGSATNSQRTPPTAAIEMPKVELAVGGPPVVRL